MKSPASAISGPIAAAVFMSMPIANHVSSSWSLAPDSSPTERWILHEFVPDRLADLGVAARGVGLELAEQELAVAQQVAIREADGLEHVLGGRVLGASRAAGRLEGDPRPAEPVAHGGDEEVLLRAEQLEEVRLAHAGALGDRVGRGAVVARPRELGHRGGDDLVASLVGGKAGGRCHGA